MNGTPWGYIQQKNRANAAEGRSYTLEKENEQLKKIMEKLLGGKTLNDSDKKFLKSVDLLSTVE